MSDKKNKNFHWGKGIFLLYGGFVIFILSVVIFASMQEFSLVEDNYYNKELVYQEQITRLENTQNLDVKPIFVIDRENLNVKLHFPKELITDDLIGTIHFFRPSSKKHDHIINLKLNSDGLMEIKLDRFIKGYWKIKFQWHSSDNEYYMEQALTI